MLITKVKICGLTNYEDAVAAIDMGADLLGFNFYPESPRYLTMEKAALIIEKLPGCRINVIFRFYFHIDNTVLP